MDLWLRNKLKPPLEDYHNILKDKFSDGNLEFPKVFYGTAGFRGNACSIEHIFFNVGVIAGLRSIHQQANVGVMITASHNPIQDNGVKLIDANGQMLQDQWEPLVENFCNILDVEKKIEYIKQVIQDYDVNLARFLDITQGGCNVEINMKLNLKVLVGMDTRPSSEALADLVKLGLQVWNPFVTGQDYGILTTPALHYLVAQSNRCTDRMISLDSYLNLLKDACSILHLYPNNTEKLTVDCANGVGTETMKWLIDSSDFAKFINVKLINCYQGTLNKDCGADLVKSSKIPPEGANELDTRYASLDGDADRLVYFYLTEDFTGGTKLNLVDGDKILTLFSTYIVEQLNLLDLKDELTLGVIQTPYANGASTDYLKKQLNLEAVFADTGVKYLHSKAKLYDLGVYFEANGHGTIYLSDKAQNCLQNLPDKGLGSHFKHVMLTLNNYTGDAVADLILVEILLRHFNLTIRDWDKKYTDRPNFITKMRVPDRSLFETKDFGMRCVKPDTIQPAIDRAVAEYGPSARCFVRPSGTEDVLRIYSEAETQEQAEKLANEVKISVDQLLNL